jgi:predicted amidohydrolase
MKFAIAAALFSAVLCAESVPFRNSGIRAADVDSAEGWKVWAPRPEIAPRTFVDSIFSRNGGGSLAVSGDSNAAVFGGWQRTITGIEAGKWYRFRAAYRAEGLDYPARQVLPRLDWQANGKRTGQPEYPWKTTADGEWTVITMDAEAPPKASAVNLQLLLLNAPRATVYWDEVSLTAVDAPPARQVSVVTVNLYPRGAKDPVGDFISLLDRTMPAKADVALLPEGITIVGTGKTYADVAEPIPGPTTERLGELAKRKNTWLVAGIIERERQTIYNTAVLIDREGRVAGRYRKVYLPREEIEGGITPGSDYPVFRTDFGTVGLMICWDIQFADPARALALRGAEMILVPIWGGSEPLGKARAIENRVFLVSSGYDYPTYIMNPDGEIVTRAFERGTVASALVDLNQPHRDSWLGDMRGRFMKELRADTAVDPPGRRSNQ